MHAAATDFLKVVEAGYLAPTSVLPGEATKFLEKHIKGFKSLPDKIFFQKLNWFLDDLEHSRLTDADKEAMKKRIHFTANSLKYALTHEEENRWLEEFYRVIFVILNTDVYSLDFLIEKIHQAKEQDGDVSYRYNRDVQGLLSSGLMYLSAIDAGGANPEANDNSHGNRYSFTPIAYEVYKYITNHESVVKDDFTDSVKVDLLVATDEDINELFDESTSS